MTPETCGLEHKHKSKFLKILLYVFGKYDHFLNDFDVILALFKAIGILFFAFKIGLAKSQVTRNIYLVSIDLKIYLLKMEHQMANLCSIFSNFSTLLLLNFLNLDYCGD